MLKVSENFDPVSLEPMALKVMTSGSLRLSKQLAASHELMAAQVLTFVAAFDADSDLAKLHKIASARSNSDLGGSFSAATQRPKQDFKDKPEFQAFRSTAPQGRPKSFSTLTQ